LIDDSDDIETIRQVDAFHRQYPERTTVVRRPFKSGYKAGNLNNVLQQIHKHYEFFVIADADTVLPCKFVVDMLPSFKDPGIGFVQALQRTPVQAETDGFSALLSPSTEIYWREFVLRAQSWGFVMFHGHAGIVRTQAWRDIGGFPEVISEDLAFSTMIRQCGYRGTINDAVICDESFPETYSALCRRQRKYVLGAYEHLRKGMSSFVTSSSVPIHEKVDRCIGTVVLMAPCWSVVCLIGLLITPGPFVSAFARPQVGVICAACFVSMSLPATRALWRHPGTYVAFSVATALFYLSITFRATFDVLGAIAGGVLNFPVTGDRRARGRERNWKDLGIDICGIAVCSILIFGLHVVEAIPLLVATVLGMYLQLLSNDEFSCLGAMKHPWFCLKRAVLSL
jgi:cellulose synthase/poly-beta-1,6-N-acetylglucosamine synthase-like glycosyltransferase